jgi:hypothetical protein
MAYEGGSHVWELGELESMKLSVLLCVILVHLSPTCIPNPVGSPMPSIKPSRRRRPTMH